MSSQATRIAAAAARSAALRALLIAAALLPGIGAHPQASAQERPVDYATIACAIDRAAPPGVRECARLGAAQRCGHVTDFPSRPTQESTGLTIFNRSAQPIRLYWLDGSAARALYGTVQPGGRINQPSHIGANWMVTTLDGHCIGIFNAAPVEIAFF